MLTFVGFDHLLQGSDVQLGGMRDHNPENAVVAGFVGARSQGT